MGFHYVVLGAGRQGVALAYDLAKNCEAARITVADLDPELTRQAIQRLERLLRPTTCQFVGVICDVSKPVEVAMTVAGADVILSAVPFRFNVPLTEAAVAAQVSFCDLGGNTSVVHHQLKRHSRAAAAGISIVPDCGLAPGLGNILAADGIAAMDEPEAVHIRCGGLPEDPTTPLGYKLTFSFDGLINEYSGLAEFLRNGQRVGIRALTELEEIELPPPLGRCEAAVTSGGTSTCPETYLGRLRTYEYKTIRYPGHFAAIRALFELGCFDEHVILPDGQSLDPRGVLRELMQQRLILPDVRDLVVLRCTVSGRHQGKPCTRTYDLLDRHDPESGFSAMERSTAFPAALVAHMQARKLVAPGAKPLEVAIPTATYLEELPRHGIKITMS